MAATSSLNRATPVQPITTGLVAWSSVSTDIHIDLGTGDGAFALATAKARPTTAVIGIDACLDHLRLPARRRPANLCFVAANALTLPLAQLPHASRVTINFPYGSLLSGLVEGDSGLLHGLDALLAPGGELEVRVNATAFDATGLDPDTGPGAIARALQRLNRVRVTSCALTQAELRTVPTTWAKRLGYGRPTAATYLIARRQMIQVTGNVPGQGVITIR